MKRSWHLPIKIQVHLIIGFSVPLQTETNRQFSTIFQIYCGSQFYCRKQEYPKPYASNWQSLSGNVLSGTRILLGPSWSYGSWIYDYICSNQCLPTLTLWVLIPPRRGVLDTTLCDKICQWLATGRWFSPGIPVSSTNKTDRHDIAQILLKVALNTITTRILIL